MKEITLEQAIAAALKLKVELPHLIQPSHQDLCFVKLAEEYFKLEKLFNKGIENGSDRFRE